MADLFNPNQEAFDRFWAARPKREGDNSRQEAQKSFFRLIAAGVDPDQIIRAAVEWAEQSKNVKDKRSIPMASTWLNQRRFEGENYSQPTPKEEQKSHAAFMTAHGWQWDGQRWVKTGPGSRDSGEVRRDAQPLLSLEQKANLFVAADLPWYAQLVEMHRKDGGTQSYFGKSLTNQRPGIWVPKWWYDNMRYSQREQVNYGDVNPVKARPIEEEPPSSQPPMPVAGEAQQETPAPARKSWAEEADQDFGA